MDFSYYVEQELDRQEAEQMGLSLDEYYDLLSKVRKGENIERGNYGKSN